MAAIFLFGGGAEPGGWSSGAERVEEEEVVGEMGPLE